MTAPWGSKANRSAFIKSVVSGVAGATDTHVVHERADPTVMGGVVDSGEEAYEMAGLGPEDIDMAELHDMFTILEFLQSEALGFFEPGEGWKVALVTLMNERLAVGGGLSNTVLDVFRAAEQVELDDEPAIRNQAVREHLADWYAREMGLKYTSYRMITALSKGQDPGPEASISKVVVAANNNESSSFALDLQDYGGILDDPELSGFGNQFQRQFMRSPANRIEGGSDEILRNIISERVLGMPPDIRPDKGVPFREVPQGNVKG
jgi:acyl-CoA dehydrogenase